jgi:hypothetical protein
LKDVDALCVSRLPREAKVFSFNCLRSAMVTQTQALEELLEGSICINIAPAIIWG